MHVTLFDTNQYVSGMSVRDVTLYGSHGTPTVNTTTIDDITYEWINNLLVNDGIGSAGSVVCNAVLEPETDRVFYIKTGKTLTVTAKYETVTPNEYWNTTMSIKLMIGSAIVGQWSSVVGTNINPNSRPDFYDIRFCSVPINDDLFYGFCYGSSESSVVCVLISDNFFTDSLTDPYQGGAAGSDPDSGFGDHDTDSDSISKIGGISGVIVGPGEHGLHIYEMNSAAYKDFMYKLFSKELQIAAVRSFLSAEDSLVSLHLLPTVTRNQTTVTAINVGALFSVPVSGTVKADTAGSNVRTVDSGFVPVGTVENDFLDYQQTAAVLYIPFCGMFPIDVQDIIGGGIQIIFEIDVLQGNIVANVYTTNYQGREKLQGCYAGNCAYRLPLCGNKDGTGMIAGIIQTATGALTGSAATAVTGASQVIGSVLGTTAYAAGSTSGNSAYYSDTTCYLMLYRPNAIYPAQFAGQIGRPSGSSAAVGSYSGFLSGSVHADISGATDREKQMIESYIERGVIV